MKYKKGRTDHPAAYSAASLGFEQLEPEPSKNSIEREFESATPRPDHGHSPAQSLLLSDFSHEFTQFERRSRFLDPIYRKLLRRDTPKTRVLRTAILQSFQRLLQFSEFQRALAVRVFGRYCYAFCDTDAEGSEVEESRAIDSFFGAFGVLTDVIETKRQLSKTLSAEECGILGLSETQIYHAIAQPITVLSQLHGVIILIRPVAANAGDIRLDQQIIENCARVLGRLLERFELTDSLLTDNECAEVLSRLSQAERFDKANHPRPAPRLIANFSTSLLRRLRLLPFAKPSPESVSVYCVRPLHTQYFEEFELVSGWTVSRRVIVSQDEFDDLLSPAEESKRASSSQRIEQEIADHFRQRIPKTEQIQAKADDAEAPVVRLVNDIIQRANEQGASDIHCEPYDDDAVVRFRIDGICVQHCRFPKSVHRALVNRLKIMAQLDIAEHRLPQDGRIDCKPFCRDLELELRMSVAPLRTGESVVLRLLNSNRAILPLTTLGMDEETLNRYEKAISTPYGLILHTGPTGSGKSMSLYSALNSMTDESIKVLTAEDPVEYSIPGIQQMQVQHEIGLNFSVALRCFLRQDPDIILIGEIRDPETAKIAVEASLTGHRILSTLHTNNAIDTVIRFGELEVPPYLLAPSLVVICAQRLVRRLCHCAVETAVTVAQKSFFEQCQLPVLSSMLEPSGCNNCSETGYKGRTGIYELITATSALRDAINRNVSREELASVAVESGMKSLLQVGHDKIASGVTSFDEIRRVCSTIDIY